jgi:prepilin signal peptidase PulO-like enzyme (type II secretory pathway)
VILASELALWQQMLLTYGIPASAAILAAIFASFACVVFERRGQGITITGRSRCICGRPVAPWFNIPVLGWLFQLGRARCCGGAIPLRYVLAEISAAVIAFTAVLVLPPLAALPLSILGTIAPASASARRKVPFGQGAPHVNS